MSLVVIVGPPAVGKMTVGLSLERMTGLKLFHNHMSIELALQFFKPESPSFGRVVGTIRRVIMEEIAKGDSRGLIFTFTWAFEDPADAAAIQRCAEIFGAYGRQTYYVELEASQEERERRNSTELRLQHKPSKRDTAASREQLLKFGYKHKLNSTTEMRDFDKYLRIDNTNMSPDEVASKIQRRFDLPHRTQL